MITYEREPGRRLHAIATVRVGIETVQVRVDLGPWFETEPEPGGLALTPVVALPDERWTELARLGALRAGGQPAVLLIPGDVPALGGQLLIGVAEGIHVVIVTGGGPGALRTARGLSGRPIAAVPLGDPEGSAALFAGLDVDVHVPFPSLEGEGRARVRSLLAPLKLEAMHHLVEVDPRPALDAAGLDPERAPLSALAAAAAGVLAGRMAAANARWRAAST